MRAVITLLVLLLSMCGSQTWSTQTDLHTESQSTGAAAEVSTQLDISAELRELRDMVGELRVTLSFTRDELQNTKDLLNKIEVENDAVKQRLVASETEVVNLRKEAAAQTADLRSVTERLAVTETDMEHVKKDTEAQHTDLTTVKTEVMSLIKEQAAQEAELVVLKTRMDTGEAQVETRLSASETEVEKLKMEHAAQEAELTAVKTRLAATETEVVNLEKEITEKPKVAFSAALTAPIEAGNTDLNLVFTKTITNVRQAYSNITGFFTAPVKGVYYFRFTVMDHLNSRRMYIMMFKNGEKVMHLTEYDTDGHASYLSSGVTLQLEVGDVVNMRLPAGSRLYDDSRNHSTFSGFLLFTL
ncbi:uncharacterized protein LOC105904076 [Clupea harengus]|uniref:Uncharacterized protein LOC105904076 n=1 Tax=Clupea harengus TaxID=7950 RepID=A0A6P3W220_CLUHA|nr:uncharacterized protein LOC105904076 [Clupea harengus]